jgi:hypothetical protein
MMLGLAVSYQFLTQDVEDSAQGNGREISYVQITIVETALLATLCNVFPLILGSLA